MYDTKQLEDLGGYRPTTAPTSEKLGKESYKSHRFEKPASPPPETLGMNSHVIKPETRVNKAENAGQPLEQSEQTHCPRCGQEWIKQVFE